MNSEPAQGPCRPGQVVFTNKARCRDCYRCVRVCPVKAIRMYRQQAFVVPERCISCGTCIRECPQGAKSFRNDVEHVIQLIVSGVPVAASVAPSFAGVFSDWEQKRLPSALRKLGFAFIAETAIGAYAVARKTAEFVHARPDRPHVCTACPAVVRYVELYRPEMTDLLVPVVSPMLAHGRALKQQRGPETRVVFIGPCVAKKTEAQDPRNEGAVDAVLTFKELTEWLTREGIALATLEESPFDDAPAGDARFFPLVGGQLRTAAMTTDVLADQVISVSGFDEITETLDMLATSPALVVEPLFCPQGCINGPALPGERNPYDRRKEVLAYAAQHPGTPPQSAESTPDLAATFGPQPLDGKRTFTEEEIRLVLEKTGKAKPEDQLNCGACGYPSCREKAVAVLAGMAEVEMCIPYMKRLAEQRMDRIIETSPNGIVILDDRLNIIHMNPTFRKFFMCSEAVCGKRISYLMDPDPFEKLASGGENLVEIIVRHERYNLVAHEILYPLREEKQYVGIFVNITHSQANQEKLDQLRAQTILQARELMEHQITMAQKIGQFLGESTARGETLVANLVKLAGEDPEKGDSKGKKGNHWLWDIFTSK